MSPVRLHRGLPTKFYAVLGSSGEPLKWTWRKELVSNPRQYYNLRRPRIWIKNRFVNGVFRRAKYSVGNGFLDMQRTIGRRCKGIFIDEIFTFYILTWV